MLHELHQSACNKHFAPTIPQPPTMSYTASRLILRIFPQTPEIQEDNHKPRDFYKLLFIRLLLCTKVQILGEGQDFMSLIIGCLFTGLSLAIVFLHS